MSGARQFFKLQEQYGYNKAKEMLVLTVLEKTLSDAGIYNQVAIELDRKYNAGLRDCYRHPEYFSTTLEDHHKDMHDMIVESVSRHLEMYSCENSIIKFLRTINH